VNFAIEERASDFEKVMVDETEGSEGGYAIGVGMERK